MADRLGRETSRNLAILGLLLVATTIAMQAVPIVLAGVEPACEYTAPILCLELPHSGAQLASVLDGPTPASSWRYHLWLDCLYLVLYGTLYAASFARVRGGLLSAGLAGLGAIGDIVENFALLEAVDGDRSDTVAEVARMASLSKFFLLALGVSTGLALIARRSQRPVAKIGYGLAAAFAALGLAGAAHPTLLELGLLGLAIAALALVVRAFLGWLRPAAG